MQKEADQCGVEGKAISPGNCCRDGMALSEAAGLEVRVTVPSLAGYSTCPRGFAWLLSSLYPSRWRDFYPQETLTIFARCFPFLKASCACKHQQTCQSRFICLLVLLQGTKNEGGPKSCGLCLWSLCSSCPFWAQPLSRALHLAFLPWFCPFLPSLAHWGLGPSQPWTLWCHSLACKPRPCLVSSQPASTDFQLPSPHVCMQLSWETSFYSQNIPHLTPLTCLLGSWFFLMFGIISTGPSLSKSSLPYKDQFKENRGTRRDSLPSISFTWTVKAPDP